jgi:hypothetical protein
MSKKEKTRSNIESLKKVVKDRILKKNSNLPKSKKLPMNIFLPAEQKQICADDSMKLLKDNNTLRYENGMSSFMKDFKT